MICACTPRRRRYLFSVLEGADDATGAIAIERSPDSKGEPVDQTQPPVLAWAVLDNYYLASAARKEARKQETRKEEETSKEEETRKEGTTAGAVAAGANDGGGTGDGGDKEDEELLERLRYAAPLLAGYLSWDVEHRGDPTGKTPLLAWLKGTESGMDNSPRFDPAVYPDATHILAVGAWGVYRREPSVR